MEQRSAMPSNRLILLSVAGGLLPRQQDKTHFLAALLTVGFVAHRLQSAGGYARSSRLADDQNPSQQIVFYPAVWGVFLACIALWFSKREKAGIPIPDEKIAAFNLLAKEFTGPGYFHFDPSRTNRLSDPANSDFQIRVDDARHQIDRIVQERSLGPDGSLQLNALIDRVAEPPKSRTVGEVKVNLLRLNLALDSLDEKR